MFPVLRRLALTVAAPQPPATEELKNAIESFRCVSIDFDLGRCSKCMGSTQAKAMHDELFKAQPVKSGRVQLPNGAVERAAAQLRNAIFVLTARRIVRTAAAAGARHCGVASEEVSEGRDLRLRGGCGAAQHYRPQRQRHRFHAGCRMETDARRALCSEAFDGARGARGA